MKTTIMLGENPVTLVIRDFDSEIDLDKLCSIDYSNLYGEAVTVPALLNQMGILKAECEKEYSLQKLDFETLESDLRQNLRKEAVDEGKKLTEKGLDEQVATHSAYKNKRKEVIEAKYNLDLMDSLFWSVSAKNKKLDVIVKGVTPAELFEELQEGIINNILIKKHKSIIEKSKKS